MVLAILWVLVTFLMLILVVGALVAGGDGLAAVLFLAVLVSVFVAILGWMHGQAITWDSQGFSFWRLFRRTSIRWSEVLAVRQWGEKVPAYGLRHDHILVWARGLSQPIRFNPSWFRKADGERFMTRLLEAEQAAAGARPIVRELRWGAWVWWVLAPMPVLFVIEAYRAWTTAPALWFRIAGLLVVCFFLAYRVHRGSVRFDGQALHYRRFRWVSVPLREIHEARLEGAAPPFLILQHAGGRVRIPLPPGNQALVQAFHEDLLAAMGKSPAAKGPQSHPAPPNERS